MLGNLLVILAVSCTSKLRTVTNMFIVNLAVADLMVSVLVLPFSIIWEVFKVWIFGKIWCSIWLALDVWMCTASILNLCVISLDRYLAVTRPITYPQLMSSKRAKMLLASVWILSFLICLPPLVGWKNAQTESNNDTNLYGSFNTTTILVPVKSCPWICKLNNDAGYVVYSALGSFFIPMFVTIFFYWRIYNVAASTTKAINQGYQETKPGNRFDEQGLILRIHCGRGRSRSRSRNRDNVRNDSNNSNSKSSDTSSVKEKQQIADSYPTLQIVNETSKNLEKTPSQVLVHSSNGQMQTELYPTPLSTHIKIDSVHKINNNKRRHSCDSHDAEDELSQHDMTPPGEKKLVTKLTKNFKSHVKRFRVETKAAKTLGIIVGVFVACWLPFFTLYLIRPFFPNFVNPVVFNILFWLGYCNSAINPFIYGFYSKDFRFAFKRIVCCRCFSILRSNISRRGSDASQLAGRNDRNLNCLNRAAQQGNSMDSDPELGLKATHSQSEPK
ncbi:hypothetical protein PUN28_001755 [Cardiocondyla obscurior]